MNSKDNQRPGSVAQPAVGFIGLGAMGAPMARRLIGHARLVVCDVNAAAASRLGRQGATIARTPREVADKAELVFICLPHNKACRDVIGGSAGLAKGRKLRLLVNLGTTGASFAQEIAETLRKSRITLLDAPVSGGTPGAAAGTLAVMCSGPMAAFARAEPLLRRFGTTVELVGKIPGQAQTLKLLNNLLSTTAFLVTGEAMVMGVKAGLDPEMMLRIINAGTGRNSATADKFPRAVLTRSFETGSRIDNTAKDTMLCLEEAAALGVPMWIGSAVRQYYEYVLPQGAGPRDRATLVQYLEKLAKVEIPKTR